EGGIEAGTANVNNAGIITGSTFAGISADTTASVINKNSGSISGGQFGIFAGAANVDNSGSISATGTNGVAILANTTASVINRATGTISGQGAGTAALTAKPVATFGGASGRLDTTRETAVPRVWFRAAPPALRRDTQQQSRYRLVR